MRAMYVEIDSAMYMCVCSVVFLLKIRVRSILITGFTYHSWQLRNPINRPTDVCKVQCFKESTME